MLWPGTGNAATRAGTERRGHRADRTGGRARRGDRVSGRRPAPGAGRPRGGDPGAGAARRGRRHPAARRAALATARSAAAAGRLPGTIAARSGTARALPAPGVLVGRGRRRAARSTRSRPSWPRAGTGWRPRSRRSRVVVAPPALARPARSWGWMLQLYALHSAGSWGIGDLGDLRDVRHLDRHRARRGRGAAQPAARDHPGAAGPALPLHPVQPALRHPAGAAPDRPAGLRPRRPGDPGRGRRAAPGDHRRPDRARPGVGGEAGRRGAAVALRGPPGAPGRRGRPAGSSPPTARWPSATARTGAAGRSRCGTRTRPAVAAARAELAPRVAFHAWLQQQVQQQLAEVRDAARAVGITRDPRPGRRLRPGGRRRLGAAGRAGPGGAGRRSAGRVQPAGPGLGAAAVAPGPAGRHRLRRLPRPAARAAAAGRRAAHRPRGRAVAAVVGAAGRVRGPRHLRALRLRGDAGRAHPGGAPGRRAGHRRGPRHRRAGGHRRAGRAQHARLARCCGSPATTTTPGAPLLPPAAAGRRSRWPPISTHDLPTVLGFLRGEHVRARAELGLLDDVAAEQAKAAPTGPS